MKKITIIAHWARPEPSASSTRLQSFADYLPPEFEVEIIAPEKKGIDEVDGVKRMPLFSGGLNIFTLAKTSIKLLCHFRRTKPAIVIGSSPTIALPFIAALCARAIHIPYVLDSRDIVGEVAESEGMWVRAKLTKLMERIVVRLSTMIFVTTKTQMHMLARLYNVPMHKMHLLSNGIDVSKVKKSFDTKKKDIDFMFLGNLDTTRDPDKLVTFLSVLPKTSHVLFVGDIGADTVVRKMRKLRCTVSLAGVLQQNEAFEYLRKSKFGLLSIPSDERLRYQLPVKVYEYMAHGLPVVVFGHDIECETRRFVNEKNVGEYFTAPSDFKKWYRQIVTDKNTYRQVSQHNIQEARKFDRQKLMRKIVPVLKKLYENNQ